MIEVPGEPHGDRIAATTWRTHGTTKVYVDEVAELADCFAIVPAFEVHPLANELDGRLCAVHLESGHI